jgi:hypothetical protein
MRTSICIPVVRPDKADNCIEAIRTNTQGHEYEIIAEQDTERIGCPRMLKRLVAKSTGNYICFLGDDTLPREGWLDEALAEMAECPNGVGVVGLNTEPGNPIAHWIAHRDMLQLLDGEFFYTGFNHCFCDDDLHDRADILGRWRTAETAIVGHDHPINGAPADEHYIKVYKTDKAQSDWKHDQRLYFRRKIARRRPKLCIGLPVVSPDVPVQFFTSFACMEKPDAYVLAMPEFKGGPFVQNISQARNDLVRQSLSEGCSHLLMADTDQVYPPQTLNRLISHGKDIAGVRVHRRYPPFDVIMHRGEVGRYEHVPDEECFSGDLVPVDATGTGCLLFDTRVFLEIDEPWFEPGTLPNGMPIGEDINFCSKARAAGYEIYVDTSIEVGHLAPFEVNRWAYELFRGLENARHKEARK